MEDKSDIFPIYNLPRELWDRCMYFYARGQPEGALPLLAVSQTWQERLLAAPEIWSVIYLDGGNDERSRVECFFHLSKTMLVELVLESTLCALDMVMKHKDRIKSLHFRNRPDRLDPTVDISFLSQKLGRCKYPNLVHIHGEAPRAKEDLVPSTLIAACPAVIGIYGAYIDQGTIPYLPPSTTTFSVSGNGVLHEGIGNHMEVLRVDCDQLSPNDAEDIRYPGYFTFPSARLKAFELKFGVYHHTLPMGRPLPLDRSSDYLLPIQAFTSASHYSLRALSITMPWYEISQIIPYLSSYTALRELKFVFDYKAPFSGTWDAPRLTVKDIGHVRKLSLSSSPFEWMAFNLPSQAPFIIQLFADNSLQYLQELWITNVWNFAGDGVLELLRTTKNLKELHLIGFTLEGPNRGFERVTFSRLEILEVDHSNDLECFDAPGLVCLSCRDAKEIYYPPHSLTSNLQSFKSPPSFLYRWREYLVTKDPTVQSFSQLRTIHLTPQNWIYREPMGFLDFSNLRVISFERDNESQAPRMQAVEANPVLNQFMLEMLLFPVSCPRLHTIKSIRYPNWALATAMFHRRNTLKTVTPILSFWLPCYPHPTILARLIQSMGTVEADSVSATVWMDETLRWRYATNFFRNHACRSCIMSGHIGCVSSDERSTKDDPPGDPLTMELLDLMPVAASAKPSIPFTMEDWMAYLDDLPYHLGKLTCNRQNGHQMVHIGPYTLEEIICDTL